MRFTLPASLLPRCFICQTNQDVFGATDPFNSQTVVFIFVVHANRLRLLNYCPHRSREEIVFDSSQNQLSENENSYRLLSVSFPGNCIKDNTRRLVIFSSNAFDMLCIRKRASISCRSFNLIGEKTYDK